MIYLQNKIKTKNKRRKCTLNHKLIYNFVVMNVLFIPTFLQQIQELNNFYHLTNQNMQVIHTQKLPKTKLLLPRHPDNFCFLLLKI